MVDFVFNIRNELGTMNPSELDFEPKNPMQERKPLIPDNQLARGIKSKSIRGLAAEPPLCGVVGTLHYEL